MPLARFNNLSQEKRSELLRVATEELVRHGVTNASLNDILAQAGLSKGSFYYYFEDKEDLIATVLETMMDQYLKATWIDMAEPADASAFWSTIEQNLARSLDLALSSPTLIRILTSLPPSMRAHPRFAPLMAREEAVLLQQISAGQQLGQIRTDVSAQRLLGLWAALDAELDKAILGREQTPSRAELEAHVHLVFDSFRRLMAVGLPGSAPAPALAARPADTAPKAAKRTAGRKP